MRIVACLLGLSLMAFAAGAAAQTVDYDADNDNLIDVRNWSQLQAITHDLDGNGNATTTAYTSAFPNAMTNMGCRTTCAGYELLNDVAPRETDPAFWVPIGGGDFGFLSLKAGSGEDPKDSLRYKSTFEGNGHTISGLRIQYSTTYLHAGLFRALDTMGRIRNVGLLNVSITRGSGRPDGRNIGALVGFNAGKVAASYALGSVAGDRRTGGLVGDNQGTIIASYANVTVNANSDPGGGLVGVLGGDGSIIASYALGQIHPRRDTQGDFWRDYGGLVGESGGTITNSYSAKDRSLLPDWVNPAPAGVALPSRTLRTPAAATGIYAGWTNLNVDDNGGNNDNPWDFGTCLDLPVLGSPFALGTQRQSQPSRRTVQISLSRQGSGQITEGSTAMYAVELDSCHTRAITLNWRLTYNVRLRRNASSDDFGSGFGSVTIDSGSNNAVFGVTVVTERADRFFGPAAEEEEWFRVVLNTPPSGYAVASDSSMGVVSVIAADGRNDYDGNNNGLIDVTTIRQLHAMRYDEMGTGLAGVTDADVSAYQQAFSSFDHSTCADGCTGYELRNDLDFNTGDAATRSDDLYWNGGRGWEPADYAATFDGNGYVISNLYIVGNEATNAGVNRGLFGALQEGGVIRGVGLADVYIDTPRTFPTGALAGFTAGGTTVTSSYAVDGRVVAASGTGGLVGDHNGVMAASYAALEVTGSSVGSLVGAHGGNGNITASYGVGRVHTTIMPPFTQDERARFGALVGSDSNCQACTVVNSYYDPATTGWPHSQGGTSKTTSQLQTPVSYSDTAGNAGTAIYSAWNVDLDGNGTADDPWNFGTLVDYPVLRGTAAGVARQFAAQPRTMLSFALTGPTSVIEGGASTAQYTVSISDVLSFASTMQWSVGTATGAGGIAPGDFADAAGTRLSQFPSGAAVIPANSSRTTFSVYIFDDEDTESRERFVVSVVSGEADLRAKVIFEAGRDSTAVTSIELSDAMDYDDDNDGLIDVATTSQLSAIRHDLEGRGLAGVSETGRNDYLAAFDVFDSFKTCPPPGGCRGYELLNDLDLSSVLDMSGNQRWTPIGYRPTGSVGEDDPPADIRYEGTFDGNGHVIRGLRLRRNPAVGDDNFIGLFSAIGERGIIRNVGLLDVDGSVGIDETFIGSLAGHNSGMVAASYALGGRMSGGQRSCVSVGQKSCVSGGFRTGGLVGDNEGTIIASYATASVRGHGHFVGGLAGRVGSGGDVIASYALGSVSRINNTRASYGGLVGRIEGSGRITNSYFVPAVSGANTNGQNVPPTARLMTREELHEPTSATGIFEAWDGLNVDGVDQGGDNDLNDDNPWDFGNVLQYPVLVFGGEADDRVARATSQQSSQPDVILTPTLTGTAMVSEGATASYVVSLRQALLPGISASWRWSVGGSMAAANDFAGPIRARVFIAEGESSTSFSVRVAADDALELEEIFSVSLSNARLTGAPANVSLRVGASTRTTIEGNEPRDYDLDNDTLIDVTTREQLEAIRYDLNGHGLAGVSAANRNNYLRAFEVFGTAKTCPTTNMCTGYELLNDVTLSGNWTPIGGINIGTGMSVPGHIRYEGTFEGNGHVIRGLQLRDPLFERDDQFLALFSAIGADGVIRNVGLLNVSVSVGNDDSFVGSLAGHNFGTVAASYALGGLVRGGSRVGGLVGSNEGTIIASYATVRVIGGGGSSENVGGLTGLVGSGGDVIASYALGEVSKGTSIFPSTFGGLVGRIQGGRITNSYFVPAVSGANTDGQNVPTTAQKERHELHEPTSATDIFEDWDGLNVDGVTGTVAGVMTLNDDNPWDFGNWLQYPVLRQGRSSATVQEQQASQPQIPLTPTLAGDATVSEGATANYVVSLTQALPSGVSASWNWLAGGAEVDAGDFRATTGRVSIAADASSASFSVGVAMDGDAEWFEVFEVSLRNARIAGVPDNVRLVMGSSTRTTIAPNEFGQITVAASPATVEEGTTATFTLRLSGGDGGDVDVEFALVPAFGELTPADLESMTWSDRGGVETTRVAAFPVNWKRDVERQHGYGDGIGARGVRRRAARKPRAICGASYALFGLRRAPDRNRFSVVGPGDDKHDLQSVGAGVSARGVRRERSYEYEPDGCIAEAPALWNGAVELPGDDDGAVCRRGGWLGRHCRGRRYADDSGLGAGGVARKYAERGRGRRGAGEGWFRGRPAACRRSHSGDRRGGFDGVCGVAPGRRAHSGGDSVGFGCIRVDPPPQPSVGDVGGAGVLRLRCRLLRGLPRRSVLRRLCAVATRGRKLADGGGRRQPQRRRIVGR